LVVLDGLVKDMMTLSGLWGYYGSVRTVLNNMGCHKPLWCFGLKLRINNIKLLFIKNSCSTLA